MSKNTAAPNLSEMQHFEQNLMQLEQLVKKMESDQLSLQDALSYFEQGVQLASQCQHTLEHAQQKVDVLLKSAEGLTRTPFATED